MVGALHQRRVDLHLPREDLLLVVREGVPPLDVVGVLGELGVRRDDPELLLPRQDLLAQDVPALVELALVQALLEPALRRGVGRVAGALASSTCRKGRSGVSDRVARTQAMAWSVMSDVEVVVRVARRADVGRAVDQVRVERGLLAGQVAVELVPAAARRPAVERPADAHLVGRHLVALAEVGGDVAPAPQDLADRGAAVGPHAGVAGVARAGVDDVGDAALVLLRPVSRAMRLGEHSALTWKLV